MRHPIRSAFCVIAAILVTFVAILVVMPVAMIQPFGRLEYTIEHIWAGTIVRLMAMNVVVEGLENLDSSKNYVFVCNHQSLMDIPLMMRFTPRQLRIIYKKELHWIPLFGQILIIARFISIDRRNRERAAASLEKAARRIHDGVNLVIFADGTRSLDGNLKPLKKGAFILAINAQTDIVPVSISGTINVIHKLDGWTDINFGRTVRLVFGKPISTKDLTLSDRDELKLRVENVIAETYEKYRDLSEITNRTTLDRIRNQDGKGNNRGAFRLNSDMEKVEN